MEDYAVTKGTFSTCLLIYFAVLLDFIMGRVCGLTITQVKLMEEFGLSRKQIQNIIQYLRQNGLVEREGSNRSGKWIVKK